MIPRFNSEGAESYLQKRVDEDVELSLDWAGLLLIAALARLLCSAMLDASATAPRPLTPGREGSRSWRCLGPSAGPRNLPPHASAHFRAAVIASITRAAGAPSRFRG